MKPTLQISPKRKENFPFTDYYYQSTRDASFAGTQEKGTAHRLQGFWKLGSAFHSAEAVRHDVTDFAVFTLMRISWTWPIVSVGRAISYVFLGYTGRVCCSRSL